MEGVFEELKYGGGIELSSIIERTTVYEKIRCWDHDCVQYLEKDLLMGSYDFESKSSCFSFIRLRDLWKVRKGSDQIRESVTQFE
jgi:hypothetical protein